jgi:histidyl-tRNA synthetase
MSALGFDRFRIRVNNRLILNGLLEQLGLTERSVGVLRAIDKLEKIQAAGVTSELVEKVGLTPDAAEKIITVCRRGASLDDLVPILGDNAQGQLGVARLRELFAAAHTAGIPAERVELDVSIARGLDYYTGTIYETFLSDLPGIGSVCSGGRYDNLAGLFTKEKLPGVGASLGLDRLLAAMEELKLLPAESTPAPILIVQFSSEKLGDYQRIGRLLRAAGMNTEVFPDAKPVGKQLKYADRKGFRIALIAGPDEFAAGVWQVKELKTGTAERIPETELVSRVREMVAS